MLLIHGYLATRGSLHLLERNLARRGHVVMSYKLGPINLGDIRDSAGLVARKVESIIAQTGVPHVDIVGHSMGGLVGLYYVKRLGGKITEREALERAFLDVMPTRRFIEPIEIGQLCAFVCCDAARSITGAAITIDGGWSAH